MNGSQILNLLQSRLYLILTGKAWINDLKALIGAGAIYIGVEINEELSEGDHA
jgi:hypothetical protein